MGEIKSINHVGGSPMVSMGPIQLRQPLPTNNIKQVDPFILLHHYGPYHIDQENNPFDLGPHPHRGFEPITLLYQGEQLHKDSLGNESIVKAGDVQWTTAGRGIIHSEAPTKTFVEKGGDLEGIQLWLNLPAAKKMMPANYQHVKSEDMPVVFNADKSIEIKIVAGNLEGEKGLINTQTSVNVFMMKTYAKGTVDVEIPNNQQSLIYLLSGSIRVNNEKVLRQDEKQFISFSQSGDFISIESLEKSNVLILSGEALNEEVVQYGPYVMNTQTEIMEAMRDYQAGKMGYLAYS